MGQAKQRKALDPYYGKIKDRTSMRGLIISPPIETHGNSMRVLGSLDPQDLRFSLFFWDRLSWPASRGIYLGGCSEAEYLQNAGILERPTFYYPGDQVSTLIKGYLSALDEYEKHFPGMWALGNGSNSIKTQEDYFDANKGIVMELQRCIPIPTKDVPLAEILEFRQKRRDELLMFRQHLDEMAAEIDSASDSVDALKNSQKKLDESCRNLIATTREWQSPIYISNFNAGLNISIEKAATSAFKTWSALSLMGLPETTAEVGAALAGLNSQLSIKPDIGFRTAKKPASPFRYAFSIEKQFM